MNKTNSSDEDRFMDQLVRMSGDLEQSDFERPGDDIIEACLLGRSSKGQRELMLAALAASASFRLEVTGMARDLQTLEDGRKSGQEQQYAIQVPGLQEFVSSRSGEGWKRFIAPRYILSLAATLVILSGVSLILDDGTDPTNRGNLRQWAQVGEPVDAGLLVASTPRSPGEGAAPVHDNSRETALSAFRQRLQIQDGQFTFRKNGAPPPSDAFRKVRVIVADQDETPVASLVLISSGAHREELWALALPSRVLTYIEKPLAELYVRLPDARAELTLFVLVHRSSEGYVAGVVEIARRIK